jgi:hypothetical protein
MSQHDNTPQHTNEQPTIQARHHIDSLRAAICDVTIAHHNYWAWHYVEQITDEQMRADMQRVLEQLSKEKG